MAYRYLQLVSEPTLDTIAKSTCRDLWMEVMLKLVTVAIVQADPFWKSTVDIVYDCPGDGGHSNVFEDV